MCQSINNTANTTIANNSTTFTQFGVQVVIDLMRVVTTGFARMSGYELAMTEDGRIALVYTDTFGNDCQDLYDPSTGLLSWHQFLNGAWDVCSVCRSGFTRDEARLHMADSLAQSVEDYAYQQMNSCPETDEQDSIQARELGENARREFMAATRVLYCAECNDLSGQAELNYEECMHCLNGYR